MVAWKPETNRELRLSCLKKQTLIWKYQSFSVFLKTANFLWFFKQDYIFQKSSILHNLFAHIFYAMESESLTQYDLHD